MGIGIQYTYIAKGIKTAMLAAVTELAPFWYDAQMSQFACAVIVAAVNAVSDDL